MRLWPDTIAGRTLTLLVAALVVFHLASLYLYQHGLEAEIDLTNEQRLAERLVSVKRAIARETPPRREDLAHSLSGGPLEIHWSETQVVRPRELPEIADHPLRNRLLQADPELDNAGLLVGSAPALPEHVTGTQILLVSMKLDDQSWVNVTIAKVPEARSALRQVLLSTTLMVVGVTAAAGFLIWSLTRSITALAAAADRSFRKGEATPMPETGPREVRALGTAFNALQGRVKRLLDDRTHALAAISHDLKTPLTRLRFRLEEIGDRDIATTMEGDIAEMEAMIDGTLDFLRGEALSEPAKPLDLAPLLDTICSDMADAGHPVALDAAQPLVIKGRRLALKRALTNLVDNAIKYGGGARVSLAGSPERAEIRIEDDGPGIPDAEIEAVVRPFYRIETSRNKETGGVGLGLSVAHAVIVSHGGVLRLANGKSGGLVVSVSLPR